MSLDKQQNQLPPLQQQQHDQEAEQEVSFRGSSLPDLLAWLTQTGIDTSCYGTGASKSVDLLWEEASLQSLFVAVTVTMHSPMQGLPGRYEAHNYA